MDGKVAKSHFSRLIEDPKTQSAGASSLSKEDAKMLQEVAEEIIRRDTEGIREHWGPRVTDMNNLCKIILTSEQLEEKGSKKVEVAQAILSAVSAVEQSNLAAPQGSKDKAAAPPPKKRQRISLAEEKFLEQQLLEFRQKNACLIGAQKSRINFWGRQS